MTADETEKGQKTVLDLTYRQCHHQTRMGVRILQLVRHGQYEVDPERLTDLGRAQAACMGARLVPMSVDLIHSSTLPRALETARIISRVLPNVPLKRSDSLQEFMPTLPRGPLTPKERAALPEIAEDTEMRLDRMCHRLIRSTRGAHRVEVVVFHGNALRALVCRALGFPLEAWSDLAALHGSLTSLLVSSRGRKLIRL